MRRAHLRFAKRMARFVVGLKLAIVIVVAEPALSQPGERPHTTIQAAAAFEPGEDRPGGAATSQISIDAADAFSQLSANMPFERELDFKIGNGLFRKNWVSSPSSTKSSDGLGPLFNARACQACHLKDGRGHPPRGTGVGDRSVSMLLRLSALPETDAQRQLLASGRATVIPDPVYGGQLQELAIQGHNGEGRMLVTYVEETVDLPGGDIARLRRPTYRIIDLGYGPLGSGVMISPRLTPPMIGLGLLEAIPEADISAREDPNDRNGDGISGRANRVWSVEMQALVLGRFGWKAGQPTVKQQTAEAFASDIGIGSFIVPFSFGDCTAAQTLCRSAAHGGSRDRPDEEIAPKLLDLVAFYARNLAVPARRGAADANILAGKRIFHETGCASCHVPRHSTGAQSPDAHLRNQIIWPYTDLLLHDMGEGLADHRPEGRADGREWRTAPLWGIGLTGVVSGHTFFLHDGRARNLTEAILWHGGEAQRARDGFARLTSEERQHLLAFLGSL